MERITAVASFSSASIDEDACTVTSDNLNGTKKTFNKGMRATRCMSLQDLGDKSNNMKTTLNKGLVASRRMSLQDLEYNYNNTKKTINEGMGVTRRMSQQVLGLPPVAPDGGYGWVIVMASFMVLFLLMGLGYSLGVYLVQFVEEFEASRGSISWIMACHNGIAYLLGPLFGALTSKIGCRLCTVAGALILSLALVAAPFCFNVILLIFVFGILGGFGLGLMYLSALVILSQYFDSKLSLANGITVSALGMSNAMYPLLIDFLIDHYGWKGSLWIIAGIVLNCAVFGALFRPFTKRDQLKLRQEWLKAQNRQIDDKMRSMVISIPDTRTKSLWTSIKYSISLLSKPVFLIFAISFFFVGSGWISDKPWCDPIFTYSLCLLLAGVATTSFPHLNSYPLLCMYCIVMGILSGNVGIMCQVIAADLVGLDRMAQSIGLLLSLSGLMNLIGMPFAGVLYDISGSYTISFYTFGVLITIGGVIMLPLRCIAKFLSSKSANKFSENDNSC